MNKWEYLGSGQYNNVYVNAELGLVFKVQKIIDSNSKLDSPERSVRLWNEVNSVLDSNHVQAYTAYEEGLGSGWVCPYVVGTTPRDDEISQCLVEIYNHTGRIVIDAVVAENFVKTPEGKIVCIDIGFALRLQQQESEQLQSVRMHRQESSVSLGAWKNMHVKIHNYIEESTSRSIKTTDMLKALLFIQINRPDIHDVSFLLNDESIIQKLAMAYVAQLDINDEEAELVSEVIAKADADLERQRPLTIRNIQESCVQDMQTFIEKEQEHLNRISDNTAAARAKLAAVKSMHAAGEVVNVLDDDYEQFVDFEDLGDVICEVMEENDYPVHDGYDFMSNSSDARFEEVVGKSLLYEEVAASKEEFRYTIMRGS